jgi:hypothetical protein
VFYEIMIRFMESPTFKTYMSQVDL